MKTIDFFPSRLKELQCKLNDSGDKNQKKRELIEKHRAHKESLEEAVESFKKRNVITQKLKLVTQKKEWALVSETQALGKILKHPLCTS